MICAGSIEKIASFEERDRGGVQRIRLLAVLAVGDVDDQADRTRGAPPLRPFGEEGLAAQQDPAGRAVEAGDAVLVLVVAAAFRRERAVELVAERRAHLVRDDALEQVGVGVDVEIVRHAQQRAQLGRPVAPPRHPVDLVHAEPGRAPHQAQPLLGVAQRLLGGKLLGIRARGRRGGQDFRQGQPAGAARWDNPSRKFIASIDSDRNAVAGIGSGSWRRICFGARMCANVRSKRLEEAPCSPCLPAPPPLAC